MDAFADSAQDPSSAVQVVLENSLSNDQPSASSLGVHPVETPAVDTRSYSFHHSGDRTPSLCIAVIGATGELARSKVFPALFALYYSGFLPEVMLLSYYGALTSGCILIFFSRAFAHLTGDEPTRLSSSSAIDMFFFF